MCWRTRPIPGQANWSDLTYYTGPGGGRRVLASGSAYFIYRMANAMLIPSNVLPNGRPGETELFWRAMENLYVPFRLGPGQRARRLGRQLEFDLHRLAPPTPGRQPAPTPLDTTSPSPPLYDLARHHDHTT